MLGEYLLNRNADMVREKQKQEAISDYEGKLVWTGTVTLNSSIQTDAKNDGEIQKKQNYPFIITVESRK